ncbi:MAG: glycosyltransferase [Pseudomonadota bacterium]|nr:glycosyltransferase [Pseudomonadota bacterium]
MKKKILFITTRNPFSGRYSGDVIRSAKIINLLKKKYSLDIVCLDKDRNISHKKKLISFNSPNLFSKLKFCLFSLLKLKPVQMGLFYSNQMKTYLNDNANNYDYLFFNHIRSAQYLPKNYYGETIIEMGDLYSENYHQTFKSLNFLNPVKYIYFFESFLVKRFEKEIFNKFDKVILFSQNEVEKIDAKFKDKIFLIGESVERVKNYYSFSKKNYRILFVGNLKYLPNFLACRNFVRNIMPKLKKKITNFKFCIIGDISQTRKKLLSSNSNVEILGTIKNLKNYIKTSFCGLANLEIATGVQGKVFTYMSHGLPVICSNKVSKNFGKNVLSYAKDNEIIEKIISLKTNKSKSNNFSRKSLKFVKNLTWKQVSKNYLKLIKL